jgi:MFS family permease
MITFSVGSYSPLIPLYAQKLGASFYDLGIIGTVFSLPYVFLPLIIGSISDKFERRYFFLLGVSSTTIVAWLFTIASNVQHIMIIRLFYGIAYAFLWPIIEALISDSTTKEKRTMAMGRFFSTSALGFLLGPLIGGIILQEFGFYYLFTTAGILGLIAVIIAFYNILAMDSHKQVHSFFQKKTVINPKIRDLIPVYIVIIVHTIARGTIMTIFPAYASNLGIASSGIGILFFIMGIARAGIALQSERVSKIGEKQALILAIIFQAISIFAIAYPGGLIYFILFIMIFGLSTGIFIPLALSIASKIAPKGRIGMSIGFVEIFTGIGLTTGPFISGLSADSLGANSPYIIIALISCLAIIPLVIWKRKEFNP